MGGIRTVIVIAVVVVLRYGFLTPLCLEAAGDGLVVA